MSKTIRRYLECFKWLAGKLLPDTLRGDLASRKVLVRWLIIGLLIRMLVMPFAVHADFQSEHWRAGMAAFRGLSYPSRIEPMSHYFDALTLRVIAPLVPEHSYLFLPSPDRLVGGLSYPWTIDYNRFADYPRVNRAIFLAKVPYLLFDLLAGLILIHLFGDVEKSTRAFAYWMLNPATIYAVYLYGRYETYGLVFILLSMLLLQRGHKGWGALALGCSLLFRVAGLFVLPVYAMAADKRWVKRAWLGTLTLLPMIGFVVLMEGIIGFRPSSFGGRNPVYFDMVLRSFGDAQIFPFIFGYMLLMLWLDAWPEADPPFRRYAIAGLAVYLLMYMFTWYSPPYFSWVMPFMVWLVGERLAFGKVFKLQIIAWAFYWFVWRDIGAFSPYLFAPISSLAHLFRPNLWLVSKFESLGITHEQVIIAARSVMFAVSGWMFFFAIRGELRRLKRLVSPLSRLDAEGRALS